MRTTITLQPDVAQLLKEAVFKSGKSFKDTVNEALLKALKPSESKPMPPAQWPTYNMGEPLVDLTKALALADELYDQELVRKMTTPD